MLKIDDISSHHLVSASTGYFVACGRVIGMYWRHSYISIRRLWMLCMRLNRTSWYTLNFNGMLRIADGNVHSFCILLELRSSSGKRRCMIETSLHQLKRNRMIIVWGPHPICNQLILASGFGAIPYRRTPSTRNVSSYSNWVIAVTVFGFLSLCRKTPIDRDSLSLSETPNGDPMIIPLGSMSMPSYSI